MAANSLKLGFVLSGTDKLSRVIDDAVNKSTNKLSAFERSTSKIGKSFAKIGAGLAGAGVALGAAVFGLAKSTADYGDQVLRASQTTGLSVENYQKLGYAARFASIGESELSQSMTELNRKIINGIADGDKAGKVFKDLGIKLKDSSGNARNAGDVFKDVADIFVRVEDGSAKSALAVELFGGSGAKLIPLLNMGSSGLEEFAKEAEAMGLILSDETINSSKDFSYELKKITASLQGTTYQIGALFLPTIEALISKFSDVISKVVNWANENPVLVDTLSKATLVLTGLLITLGSASIAIGGITFAIGKFSAAFKATSAIIAVGKTLVTSMTNSMLLFRVQYAALVVWQKLAAAAQWLFNTALLGCPVVWIVAAVAAIGAAVYLLVKNWDKVSAFFIKLWENIKIIFSKAWEWIKNMFLNYTPTGLIIKHWDGISAFFVRLWDNVKNIFISVWEWIKKAFLNLTPLGLIIKNWEAISDYFSNLKDRFVGWGKSVIDGFIQGVKDKMSKAIDTIKDFGKAVASGFKGILGINSPSKLFAEYGINITQGLTEGIESGSESASNASEGLAYKTISGASNSFDNSNTNTSNIGGVSLIYSPNVNVSGFRDGENLIENVKNVLSNNKREFERMLNDILEDKKRLAFQ